MSDIKIAYGADTTITITLASLANSSYRESNAIDNSSDKFLDVILSLTIKSGASAPSGEKVLKVFFYASEDGTNLTDNATGSDASITPRSPTNLLGPMYIQTPTAAVTYIVNTPIAQFFGGVIPPKWGIVIQNAVGAALDTTGGNHVVKYRGVYQTVV